MRDRERDLFLKSLIQRLTAGLTSLNIKRAKSIQMLLHQLIAKEKGEKRTSVSETSEVANSYVLRLNSSKPHTCKWGLSRSHDRVGKPRERIIFWPNLTCLIVLQTSGIICITQ